MSNWQITKPFNLAGLPRSGEALIHRRRRRRAPSEVEVAGAQVAAGQSVFWDSKSGQRTVTGVTASVWLAIAMRIADVTDHVPPVQNLQKS